MSKYLYQTEDLSELTAEQKDTISSIASITGTVIGASTGNSNDNGIGAAETGGAILAVGDAKEGSYTTNPDGSITGPSGGRLTSTGKFDDNWVQYGNKGGTPIPINAEYKSRILEIQNDVREKIAEAVKAKGGK